MKVFLDWIGCRLNQSEIEKIAAQFRANGHEILANPAEADLVVINTCAVTNEAASDSRQKARQAWRAGAKEVVLTGCWTTLDVESARKLPGVQHLFTNMEKDHLVTDLLGLDASDDLTLRARQPLPGSHKRTRSFIKAQDGCDNHCTFCITRLVRGKSWSVPFEQVRRDIELAIDGGAKEVVLSGVQLGAWGKDLSPQLRLSDLITSILAKTSIPRLRLSSVEPWDLDENFFALWKDNRLCPHLHLPLQSGCKETLRRMARHTTPEEYSRLIEIATRAAPDMAVTTDVIVGFQGETADEFEQSRNFIQATDFAAGHVFTYSPRPLTPALKLEGEVPLLEKKRRSALIRQIFLDKAFQFRQRFIGAEVWVLWENTRQNEGTSLWHVHGMTGNYLRVSAVSAQNIWNQFSLVRVEGVDQDGVWGKIIETK